MKEKRYSSGEIASAAGLTIRTIQHYDNIGLLRSAGRSEGGRRYYTQDDLIHLEQIVLYKSLDFSLDQIKKQLLFQPDQNELLEMFKNQQLLLLQRMEHLHTSFAVLEIMSGMIEEGKELPLTLMLQLLSALPEDDIFSKAPQMLTKEQREMLSLQFQELEPTRQFYHRVKEVLIEAMVLINDDLSPACPEAQALIKRWWDAIVSYTNGDMELIKQISELDLEDQLITKNAEMMTSAKQFMEAALEIFLSQSDFSSDLSTNEKEERNEYDPVNKPDKEVR